MTREQMLLTQLSEECNEVAQRCSKAIRFGLGEVQDGQTLNNADRLGVELTDLITVLEMLKPTLEKYETLTGDDFDRLHKNKKEKVEKYLEVSRSRGILKE